MKSKNAFAAILAFMCVLSLFSKVSFAQDISIIPKPVRLIQSKGSFLLQVDFGLVINTNLIEILINYDYPLFCQ
jgi:hypothetical protein